MPHNITRAMLNDYQRLFDTLQSTSPNDIATNNKLYTQLSKILDFIRDVESSIEGISESKFIFLVGPTGAGKSTLMNYLNLNDSHFIVANEKGEIQLRKPQESISVIGNGTSSTTIIPQPFKINGINGTFLDCAGEGDTSGILAEIINSTIKKKISSKAEQAKIILVTKQSSLDSNGGYGAVFKDSLDKSAKFFNDISHFKDSVSFVVTGSSVKGNSVEIATNDLRVICGHKNFESYKGFMSYILQKSEQKHIIETFAKASELADVGDEYSVPKRQSQHSDIINMIKDLPYTHVPHHDFFKIPITPQSTKSMERFMDAIIIKGINTISTAIKAAKPFSIYSIEVKYFFEYVSGLVKGYKSDFLTYTKVLQYNNYFKIALNDSEVKKIDTDLKSVFNFISDQKKFKLDWGKESNIINDLGKVSDYLLKLMSVEEYSTLNLFHNFIDGSIMKIKPVRAESYEIKDFYNRLDKLYKEIDELRSLKNDQTSKYYKDKSVDVVTGHTTVQTPGYWENKRVDDYRDKWFLLPFIKTGNKAKTGYHIEKNFVPGEKYEVPITEKIYIKTFDEELYKKDLNHLNNKISENKKNIKDSISNISVPKVKLSILDHNQLNKTCNQNDPELKNLLTQWYEAEWGNYVLNNPHNTLQVLDIETIGNNVEGFDGQFQM